METQNIEIDLEAAAEFMLRRRGRVRARWVIVPVVALWLGAVWTAFSIGRARSPELVPYVLALYGCVAFFVHAYVIGWRSGAFVWRYAALASALLFYAVLASLHWDDALAVRTYGPLGPRDQPPAPALLGAVGANIVASVLLTVHGFFLGTGSHAPPTAPTAPAPAPPPATTDAPAPAPPTPAGVPTDATNDAPASALGAAPSPSDDGDTT
ncbi:MAG: hypothetical protein H6698_03340 [Myxococcales bacterium]|nr:hypothetical protein [Myxococcales bacterium]MCB9519315.1 hypothetical protein [Myxococcales bacterium]MCB9530759.1 hypothetical protein [Myxococcales bacterium]MCB9533347.1 hypothetical protein [Myxococcales bacterium]